MDQEEDDEDFDCVKKRPTLDKVYTARLIKSRRMLRYLSFSSERQTLVSLKFLPTIKLLI
jgi:hypothetical protein